MLHDPSLDEKFCLAPYHPRYLPKAATRPEAPQEVTITRSLRKLSLKVQRQHRYLQTAGSYGKLEVFSTDTTAGQH